MKHKTYIAALLAGMLALAGCGGGSSSDPGPSERMQMEMQALETATGNLETALKAAENAGDDVTDVQITAITTAWNALKAELDKDNEADETTAQAAYDGAVARLSVVRANKRAGDASNALETARMGRETAQKGELTSADTALSTALSTALDADAEDVTEAMVTAITDARAALEAALRRAVDVSDEDKAQYQRNVEDSSLKLQTVQAKRDIAKAAEATREANERAGNAAKRANAASLKKALDTTPRSSNADYQRIIADEDNKTATVVAALEGWQGAEYKKDKTEVRVYRKTQAGKMGDPINKVFTSLAESTSTLPIDYSDFGQGALSSIDSKTVQPEWIKIAGFTATAGIQQFPNTHGSGPENTVARIPGTFYGVSGTYYCTPAKNNTCAVEVHGKNQKLGQVVTGPAGSEDTNTLVELRIQAGGPGWRFQPASLTARVTDGEDTTVAEYGWWLTKPAIGDWMVNVFVYGGGATALGAAPLPSSGTAKYVGGAAGKFAFSSVIADRHEAGHFTAKVELNAKFDDNTISGTVNEFKGDADGMDKWSVALGTSRIGNWDQDGNGSLGDGAGDNVDNGLIVGKFDDPAAGAPDKDSRTTWTIDGTAEAEAGSWDGRLWNLTNGVPAVATGVFEAEYGSAATMIGAFGADKQ